MTRDSLRWNSWLRRSVEVPRPSTQGQSLRILQVVSSPTTSGPCVHVADLARQLRALGHTVTILARPHSWIVSEAQRLGIETIETHFHRFPPTEVFRLRQEVRRRGFDLIHTHMNSAHNMGVILRALCGIPCVATAHSRKIQAHWLLNNHIVATSHHTERFHRAYNRVPATRISTIYCPVPQRDLRSSTRSVARSFSDIRELRARWGCRDAVQPAFLIGVVGEISPAKGHRFLIEAMRELCPRFPNLRLVVVGNHREEYVRQLQHWSCEWGIADRIHWAGFQQDIELAMSAMDLYVCPSLSESLPLTLLEAMAAARPIIATAVGGVPEIIQNERTGLLIPPRQSAALGAAIERMMSELTLATRCGQQAQARILADFEPTQQTQRLVELYRRLTGGENIARVA